MAAINLTSEQIQAISNGDVNALAESLPLESERARKEAERLIRKLSRVTQPRKQRESLADVKGLYPEPGNRETKICLLSGNRVVRSFTSEPVQDSNGEWRAPKGMEPQTAKYQLRKWLTENPSEYEKVRAGKMRIEIRHSAPRQ